ncbi:hypothetical protein GHT06_001854 [Daphnia sinensis]|uniref:ATP-dependent DNA ligase family profile domain-containing protein n=1 Tax=Daphnia sinensis TaxID=1820382 RepID=A0AAD5KDP5_9CRUS|nr:hypothetical protein GHT06_001854 [Daphnia sinensis]
MRGKKYVSESWMALGCYWLLSQFDPVSGHRDYSFTAYSRNGKTYENFDHIGKALCDQLAGITPSDPLWKNVRSGFVLDGEVMSSDFQSLMKQARRKTDVDTTGIVFNVFDYVPLIDFQRGFWNANQTRRKEKLTEFAEVFSASGCINLMEYEELDLDTESGKDRLKVMSEESIRDGYEGVIVKSIDSHTNVNAANSG